MSNMDKVSSDFDDFHNMLLNPIEKYTGSILEVGSGEGHLSNYIHTKGRSIVSLDINGLKLAKAKQTYPNLNLIQGDAQNLPFSDNSIDIIISIENFEHLPDVNQHIFEVKRVLKSNGVFLIKTPNKIWDTPYWLAKGSSYKELKKPGSHISTQTYSELKKRLEINGFDVTFLNVTYLHPSRKQNGNYNILSNIFKYLNRYLPFYFKFSLFCIAVKKD